MGHRWKSALGAIAYCVCAVVSGGAGAASAAVPSETVQGRWVTSWASALQSIPDGRHLPPLYRAVDVSDRTVREIVYPTLSGAMIRIRFSNAYGRQALVLTDIRLARSAGGLAIHASGSMPVRFGGRARLVLQPGQEADSDPIPFELDAGAPYAISAHAASGQTVSAWHRVANQINAVSIPGDHTADAGAAAYPVHFTEHLWATRILVEDTRGAAIAAIGDSITDGLRSSLNANRRWPDGFVRRLREAGERRTAVLNLGISGNRLLSDSPCYGESLERRFAHDALDAPGVSVVTVLIGINDINFATMPPRKGLDCDEPHTRVTAQDLIDGYRRLIEAAHRRGTRIFGATLTPASLPPSREGIREAVNAWIRGGSAFDGVIDFDAALRDPRRPSRLRAEYDSGDHIHPSDAGYARMAAALPLEPLSAAAHRR